MAAASESIGTAADHEPAARGVALIGQARGAAARPSRLADSGPETRDLARASSMPHRTRSTVWPWCLVAMDAAAYVASVWMAVAADAVVLKLTGAVTAGVIISRLFVLGHDACHGSFFHSRRTNAVVGRLLFLPSLTPYSLWAIGHNVAHHGYTNLKGRDHVWTPLSPAEYTRLTAPRRALERFYRTPAGLAAYYIVELWWKRLIFPRAAHVGARRMEHWLDGALVAAYAPATALTVVALGWSVGASPWSALTFGLIVPFVIWNVLMGFVIYVQHTHEDIAWFGSKREWSWFQAQVRSTPHVELPAAMSRLLHNIMEHTAHHVDMQVPLYRLPEAQAALEATLGSQVYVYRWSWPRFLRTMRRCKLYDYERHAWLDFEGRVTARPVFPVATGAIAR